MSFGIMNWVSIVYFLFFIKQWKQRFDSIQYQIFLFVIYNLLNSNGNGDEFSLIVVNFLTKDDYNSNQNKFLLIFEANFLIIENSQQWSVKRILHIYFEWAKTPILKWEWNIKVFYFIQI